MIPRDGEDFLNRSNGATGRRGDVVSDLLELQSMRIRSRLSVETSAEERSSSLKKKCSSMAEIATISAPPTAKAVMERDSIAERPKQNASFDSTTQRRVSRRDRQKQRRASDALDVAVVPSSSSPGPAFGRCATSDGIPTRHASPKELFFPSPPSPRHPTTTRSSVTLDNNPRRVPRRNRRGSSSSSSSSENTTSNRSKLGRSATSDCIIPPNRRLGRRTSSMVQQQQQQQQQNSSTAGFKRRSSTSTSSSRAPFGRSVTLDGIIPSRQRRSSLLSESSSSCIGNSSTRSLYHHQRLSTPQAEPASISTPFGRSGTL